MIPALHLPIAAANMWCQVLAGFGIYISCKTMGLATGGAGVPAIAACVFFELVTIVHGKSKVKR